MGPKKGQDAATEAAKAQARITAGTSSAIPVRKPSDTDSDLDPPSSKRIVTDDPRNSMDDSASSSQHMDQPALRKPDDLLAPAAPLAALSANSKNSSNSLGLLPPLPPIPIPDALVVSLGPAGSASLAPYLSAIVTAGVEQVEQRLQLHITNTVKYEIGSAIATSLQPMQEAIQATTNRANELTSRVIELTDRAEKAEKLATAAIASASEAAASAVAAIIVAASL